MNREPTTTQASEPHRQPVPALCCDLCQWPMTLPEHCREQGEILGLLVCAQCVEDQLEASTCERLTA